jgi:hypothetical protein
MQMNVYLTAKGLWDDYVAKDYDYVGKDYDYIGKDYEYVGKDYDYVGKDYNYVGKDYEYVGKDYDYVGKDYDYVGKDYDYVGKDYDYVGKDYDYVGKDFDYVGKDSNEVPLECKPKALKIREVRVLYYNKDIKCTYNVTLWCVRVTIVAVQMQQCILCFFPHYVINGTIFGKHLLNIKCGFRFSLQLLSNTFPILKKPTAILS